MKQKTFRHLPMLLMVGVAAVALAQTQTPIPQDTSSPGRDHALQPGTSALRILTPRWGQALSNTFVTVRFELERPNPGGSDHNFLLRLDGRDPIKTSEDAFTFTGMRSGQHVLTVTEVDANGTPLPDARAEVDFTVTTPENATQPVKGSGRAVPSE